MVQYANIISNGSSGGSGYSSLSGAMRVSSVPCYLLPQTIYHPPSSCAPGNASPVTFNTNGTVGMPLRIAGGNFSSVASSMKGGSDLIFQKRPDITRVNLRIMWPGYSDDIPRTIMVDTSTTRAKLANEVAKQILIYMERAAKSTRGHGKYTIGNSGINTEQVSLLSIQNTHDTNWQATLYISV
ncbi:hypothetical protein HYPSUDRAFT_59900 [Hypholoma sublateritium FD-334 SS-4]|uniref:Uncharacterized protein n=1 Tax=Hypholoma sublateritium (strain FD-334 SS-4) TaxID=945553 RepID=A0A0D2LRH1_HYPSF|nr:hypothetical protein HYPSUDRAFT_59900 [Hypholoma sublateritium FD-334 SS-4]